MNESYSKDSFIIRKLSDKKYTYYLHGKILSDDKTIFRIKKLCIPPSWKNVKISISESDYLQATGEDASGRKQYVYHPMWNQLVKIEKYDRLKRFSEKFGKICLCINNILQNGNLNEKEYVVALVLRILIYTHSRIGNDIYAKENNTYGLTTLLKKHVKVKDKTIHLVYIGKHSIRQELVFSDNICSKIIKELINIPGDRLFKTSSGEIIKSNDINNYLSFISGDNFTCKDFRTYSSNLLFIKILSKKDIPKNITQAKKNVNESYKDTSLKLGHTSAISKGSYVIPMIQEKYINDPEDFIKSNYKVHDII